MTALLTLTDGAVTCRHCAAARPFPFVGPHLAYLVVSTNRIEECRAFYESLGLVFQWERHGDGPEFPEHYAARFRGGIVLELYPARGRGPSGPRRLGVVLPPTGGPAGYEVMRDPDGRTVEAITPGPDRME